MLPVESIMFSCPLENSSYENCLLFSFLENSSKLNEHQLNCVLCARFKWINFKWEKKLRKKSAFINKVKNIFIKSSSTV